MSNKSKAIANKALKRAKRNLKQIQRNKDLYFKLVELDESVGHTYIESNFNAKSFVKLNDDLEKFSQEFEDAGGNSEHFSGMVIGSIFLNRDLMKDMIKSVEKQ